METYFEAFRQLRVQDDPLAALDFKIARDGSLAVLVGGLARVTTSVALVDARHFQDDEAKVEDGLDARTGAQRLAVVEPFDAQRWIADGNHAALKVRHTVLAQRKIGRTA